jgi:hypothetical protein
MRPSCRRGGPSSDDLGMFRRMTKIFTRAHVPPELEQAWLQHLRDFDTAHPGCHFEVMIDASYGLPLRDVVERLRVEPPLTFTEIFEREHLTKLRKPPTS